ncbi:ORF78 [Helicoverpa armigera SNPV]|uniref:HzSNPV unique ORF n=1 Tax=Helicoverpa zea single nucleopolyhedrovirus TaxID=10468 RepID=Q8V5S2_9ABAC|nr:ORF79 [Helicoverpa zea single nucleopolyhedrovirus]AHN05454.1 HzSNPV unique ORF [Helicoverpa zea single nucleopolyhedrovirus]AIG63257.1 ORF78 [Helicoverpa armigera SNPV]
MCRQRQKEINHKYIYIYIYIYLFLNVVCNKNYMYIINDYFKKFCVSIITALKLKFHVN